MKDQDLDGEADQYLPKWARKVPREARRFQGQRAGFVTRLLANGIDAALVGTILVVMYLLWTLLVFSVQPINFEFPDVSFLVVFWVAASVAWLYLTVSWATIGRTIGARVMGIRVVGAQRHVMHLVAAAARAAFCLAFMPGFFWVIFSAENRSLQDTFLRTSVIHDWTRRASHDDEE